MLVVLFYLEKDTIMAWAIGSFNSGVLPINMFVFF